MNNIYIEKTKISPAIDFSMTQSLLMIQGNSSMKYTYKFYEPIIKQLNFFFSNKSNKQLTLYFELIVINSMSARILSEFFDLCIEAQRNGFNIDIVWSYNIKNNKALKLGEDYQVEFDKLNFYLLSYSI